VRPKRRRAGVAVKASRQLMAADRGPGCLEALVDRGNSAAPACFSAGGFSAAGTDPNGMVVLQRPPSCAEPPGRWNTEPLGR
jgi:hypothetical protein